jgi:hypothetical protein
MNEGFVCLIEFYYTTDFCIIKLCDCEIEEWLDTAVNQIFRIVYLDYENYDKLLETKREYF